MKGTLFILTFFFCFPLLGNGFEDNSKWYDITSIITNNNDIYKVAVLETEELSEQRKKKFEAKRIKSPLNIYSAYLFLIETYKTKRGVINEFVYQDLALNRTVPQNDVVILASDGMEKSRPYQMIRYKNIFYSKDFENLYFNSDKVGKEFDSELFMKSQNFKCYSKAIAEQIVDKHLEKSEAPFQLLNRFDVRDQVRSWRVEGGIHFLGVALTKHCFKVGKKDCSISSCH